jgi:hypothetical protein
VVERGGRCSSIDSNFCTFATAAFDATCLQLAFRELDSAATKSGNKWQVERGREREHSETQDGRQGSLVAEAFLLHRKQVHRQHQARSSPGSGRATIGQFVLEGSLNYCSKSEYLELPTLVSTCPSFQIKWVFCVAYYAYSLGSSLTPASSPLGHAGLEQARTIGQSLASLTSGTQAV